MSVLKIKSDLNGLCSNIPRIITECERVKIVVSSLGLITENDLQKIITSSNNLENVVNIFERNVKMVHNECSIELDIFFKTYNQQTQKIIFDCKNIKKQLENLKETAQSCFKFYQISDEIEWIVMCGITPELFMWIVQPLYTFKNQLQMLQLKTYENNNKLIMKVR